MIEVMKDQAENLRQLVMNRADRQATVSTSNTRIITIASGKGGVGKTNFTINLGILLQKMGYKVLIIDADLGLGNVDIMLGLSSPYNLSHIVFNGIDIQEVIIEGPSGIMILPGGNGLLELANLKPRQLDKFIRELTKLESMVDIILIDTGAGLSANNIKMILAANEVILITTPEPTSLMDVYGVVKIVSKIDRNRHFNLVMNKVDNINEANNNIKNIQKAGKRFLNVEISTLGLLDNSSIVSKSVKDQRPFVLDYPHSKISKQLNSIVNSLTGAERGERMTIKTYIYKLFKFFENK